MINLELGLQLALVIAAAWAIIELLYEGEE